MKKFVLFILFLFAVAVVVPVVIYFASPGLAYEAVMFAERRASGLEKKKLYVGEHTIQYLEGGKGETVILLHGFAANKDTWTKFAKSMTPNFHIIAFDLPGFGESSQLKEGPHSISAQAAFLHRITNVMKLGSFHLAGSSMGGAIAGRYAAEYQNKVSSLALFDAAGVPSPQKSEFATLLEKGKNPFFIENTDDFDQMLEFVFFTPPPILDRFKQYFTEQSIARRPFEEKVVLEIIDEKYSMIADLRTIKNHQIKTLVVWGNKDRIIDLSTLRVLEKAIPEAEVVVMKDCGHVPMLEKPEEAAEHYSNFLKKL